jgi:hypothetical protein
MFSMLVLHKIPSGLPFIYSLFAINIDSLREFWVSKFEKRPSFFELQNHYFKMKCLFCQFVKGSKKKERTKLPLRFS